MFPSFFSQRLHSISTSSLLCSYHQTKLFWVWSSCAFFLRPIKIVAPKAKFFLSSYYIIWTLEARYFKSLHLADVIRKYWYVCDKVSPPGEEYAKIEHLHSSVIFTTYKVFHYQDKQKNEVRVQMQTVQFSNQVIHSESLEIKSGVLKSKFLDLFIFNLRFWKIF